MEEEENIKKHKEFVESLENDKTQFRNYMKSKFKEEGSGDFEFAVNSILDDPDICADIAE